MTVKSVMYIPEENSRCVRDCHLDPSQLEVYLSGKTGEYNIYEETILLKIWLIIFLDVCYEKDLFQSRYNM